MKTNVRKYRPFILSILSVLIAAIPVGFAQDVEIHQFDVGQGDAALVIIRQPSSPLNKGETERGSYNLLIDSGPKGKGRKVIVPYLRKLHIDTLDAIISTHYHADHIGGVNEVLNSEVVLKCYDRGGSYDSKTFNGYVSLAGLRRTTLNAGDTLFAVSFPNSSNRCSIMCVASGGNILHCGYTGTSDENTNSIAILLTYIANADTFKFFTAGDLTGNQESLLAKYDSFIRNISVMKISHHGSQTATNLDALHSFAPKAVFISCGDNNQYGHPHAETLKTLDDQKSIEHVYQTERGANVGEKSIVSRNIIVKVYSNDTYTIITHGRLYTLHYNRGPSSLFYLKRLENPLRKWSSVPLPRALSSYSLRRFLQSPPQFVYHGILKSPPFTGNRTIPTKSEPFSRVSFSSGSSSFRQAKEDEHTLLYLNTSALTECPLQTESSTMHPIHSTSYVDGSITLSIRPPVYVKTISVLNILGTTLRRFSPRDYLGSVSISDNFNSGAYFILVKTSERIFVNKVLVPE
jgi:competence protein ComEC